MSRRVSQDEFRRSIKILRTRILAEGGVSDGDKGDVIVSSSGSSWSLDANSVTNAKLSDMAEATIKGRPSGSGTGDPQDMNALTVRALLGIIAGEAVVTVPHQSREWSENVSASGVVPTSVITLAVAPHADADENTAEMLDLAAMSGTPGEGQITIRMAFSSPTSGPIRINWSAL